jgi:hypothetical protein
MSMLAFYTRNGRLYMARLSEEGQQAVDDATKNAAMPASNFWTELSPVSILAAMLNLVRLMIHGRGQTLAPGLVRSYRSEHQAQTD